MCIWFFICKNFYFYDFKNEVENIFDFIVDKFFCSFLFIVDKFGFECKKKFGCVWVFCYYEGLIIDKSKLDVIYYDLMYWILSRRFDLFLILIIINEFMLEEEEK